MRSGQYIILVAMAVGVLGIGTLGGFVVGSTMPTPIATPQVVYETRYIYATQIVTVVITQPLPTATPTLAATPEPVIETTWEPLPTLMILPTDLPTFTPLPFGGGGETGWETKYIRECGPHG